MMERSSENSLNRSSLDATIYIMLPSPNPIINWRSGETDNIEILIHTRKPVPKLKRKIGSSSHICLRNP